MQKNFFTEDRPCPCHSGKLYRECCQKYHLEEKTPETALALMRSRYSAYVLGLSDYIIRTTHQKNPRYQIDQIAWKQQITLFSEGTVFQDLEIVSFEEGEIYSFVTFRAILLQGDRDASFTERSQFERVAGRWLYLEGRMKEEG